MARKTFTAGEVLTADNTNLYLSNEQKFTSSTATAYTLTADDRYYLYSFTASTAITLTISTATAFQAGERLDILQDGTGAITVTAGSGVTLAGAGTAATSFTIGSQYQAASIVCVDTDAYRIIGNVTAV